MKRSRLLILSALALAAACENPKAPTAPTGVTPPTDPSAIISDGAHGGNPDFFFLPPMVPLPLNNPDFEIGKFNNALKPSLKIEICELKFENFNSRGLPSATTGCVAGSPLKTFPPGSVQLVNLPLRQFGWWSLFGLPPDGFYYVLWDTRQSGLAVNKFYRIKVLIDGSITPLGIADVDPISNLRQWKYTLTGEVVQLVEGWMLPIPFRVERGALCAPGTQCNSATVTNNNPAGSTTVTVDGGAGAVAGAKFPNGWLPVGGPQSVVVTISSVNTGASDPIAGTETVPCHANLPLLQFRGCYNFTTTPTLAAIDESGRQFAIPVTVAVCYVLQGTGDPREKFAEMWASGPRERTHALEDASDVGILSPATRNCATNVIGLNNSKGVMGLASTGWRKVKEGFARAFGVQTAYAVDLGLGGFAVDFSNVGPALSAFIAPVGATALTLPTGGTIQPFVRVVGSNHHDGLHQNSTGLGGLSLTFVDSGPATLSPQGTLGGTATELTAITNTLPINPDDPASGGGYATVNWTIPNTPGTYKLTVNGPANGGPVTFIATVPNRIVGGGIFRDRKLGIIGTVAVWDPIAFNGGLRITGPPGWNDGSQILASVYQPTGTSGSRSLWWNFVTPISGSYLAQSISIEPLVQSPFSVDANAEMSTPRLVSVSQAGPGQAQVSWDSQSSGTTCLVRVNDTPYPGFAIAEAVVPCAQQSYAFTALPLTTDNSYQAVVFEFSQDVIVPGPFASMFNIGADNLGFVATFSGILPGPFAPIRGAGSATSVVPPSPPVGP
jgi:hypothetical protein